MSRAMNIALAQPEVLAECAARGIKVSAVEVLPGGAGTHLVCTTIEGADEIRAHLHGQLIAGKVKRFPFYRAPGAW